MIVAGRSLAGKADAVAENRHHDIVAKDATQEDKNFCHYK
jgi:hypothetical protein